MSSFNVLRYSLLGAGVVYGAYHRYSIESSAANAEAQIAWKKEEKLIKQAKAEYAKLHAPKAQPATGAVNWEDPNLDFGKALDSLLQKLD